MAYEYGSQQVEIPNPFKFEGLTYTIRGGLVLLLGLYTLLQVSDHVAAGERALGIAGMVGGLLLLLLGIVGAYVGLFKMFRFYVGRGQPADLVTNASSEQSVTPGSATGGTTGFRSIYRPETLADMLLSRTNPTFREPQGWLPRLLHTVARRLIFLPFALRNDATSRFVAAASSVAILVLLALAWFSAASGILPVSGTPVMTWVMWVVTGLLFVVWLRQALRRSARGEVTAFRPYALAFWMAAAVLTPVVLYWLHGARPLPEPPFSPYPWFAFVLAIGAAATVFSLLLAARRSPAEPPLTQVSEYREHWQETVHPMDIFRAVEITLANHRFQEIPNRIYENDVPELLEQGAQSKGEFKGRTIQEIQPRPVADRRGDRVIRAGVVAGQALLLASALCLFAAVAGLGKLGGTALSQLILAAVLLWVAGRLIARTASLYLSEIEFESDLIAFAVTGTFSESRLATGMSIYDSTRSENLVVRSSLTPWLLVSRIRTSTLAVSGAHNLEQLRLVLDMAPNDALSNALVQDARAFLKDRQIMAAMSSEADLESAANIYRMNERTRAGSPGTGEPLIPQELRDERAGPGGRLGHFGPEKPA